MLHHLLLLLLPVAALANLKAVTYGEISSAQTLFPAPEPTNIQGFVTDDSKNGTNLVHVTWRSDLHDLSVPAELQDAICNDDPNFHENLDINPAQPDHATSGNLTDDKLERRAFLQSNQPPRVRAFRGTMQIDCYKAVEVCRNAGYYQNCLRGAAGNNQLVKYYNGPYTDQFADDNRLNSGVTTDWGTPCNAWPFAQRFWHPQYPPKKKNKPPLNTDEWPMATMYNQEFDEHATTPHVSLRCMESNENQYGSTAWTNFRSCKGPYNTNPKNAGYKKYKGMWARHREGLCRDMANGDWFYVNFNLDAFPNPVTKPADQAKWE